MFLFNISHGSSIQYFGKAGEIVLWCTTWNSQLLLFPGEILWLVNFYNCADEVGHSEAAL